MTDQDDPWEGARASQREAVASALAPRERRCPSCGSIQRGGGRLCAECGADLTARAPRRIPWRALLIAGAVVLVVAAVAVPVVGGLREDAAGERTAAQQRQARLVEAERARQMRDQRPVRLAAPAPAAGEDTLAHRERLLHLGERRITADAQARIAAGTLDGKVEGTLCEVFPETEGRRAAERDPATKAARYDCVAYSSKLESAQGRTAVFGHPYWLVIDYEKPELVWCKVTPRAGEGGSVLVSVPVPEPCRDPAGPG
jgi:hypothetical protein